MAERDPAWAQDGSYTATEDRGVLAALFGARHFVDLSPAVGKLDAGGGHGVVGATDLTVTAGAGHSVNVAAGQAVVRGTQQGDQGVYVVSNDASKNVGIATPDATNARIDLIQARVSDTDYGAGSTVFVIDAKTGTPAGSPSAPTPDENSLVLATVLVPASAASSANYTITDRRTRAAALGGVLVAPNAAGYPDPAAVGQPAYRTDGKRFAIYDGSAWQESKLGTGVELIQEVTLGSASASVTFSSIPQTFRDLLVEVSCATAAAFGTLFMRFNGVSDASYMSQRIIVDNGTVSGSSHLSVADFRVCGTPGTDAPSSDDFASININIPGYRAGRRPGFTAQGAYRLNGTNWRTESSGGKWGSTASSVMPITSISFRDPNGNFVAGSNFRLYGIW